MTKKARPAGTAGADTGPDAWRVPVTVDHIPDTGLHREIEASPETCASVAALAGVRAVSEVSAVFDVVREGVNVHVTGRVRARVGQTCVVTLEPLETVVDEPIELTFAPPTAAGTPAATGPDRASPEEEPPEPLTGSAIDLGAIATEFLILAIDPYPRKEGAAFAPPPVEDDTPHPFAALAALKKRPGGGDA